MPTRSNVIRECGDVLEIVMTQNRKAIVDNRPDVRDVLSGKRWYCAGRRSRFTVGYTPSPGNFITLASALGLPPVHANGDPLDHRSVNMVEATKAAKRPSREWPRLNAVEGTMTLDGDMIARFPPQYANQVSGYRWRYIPANGNAWHAVRAIINGRDIHLARYIYTLAHGPVPDGHAVRCLNGDRLDCRLDNLELFVPRMGRKQRE